jgi:hypothetical protein
MPAQTVIKLRRDTDANWASTNPTLAAGEAGFESDTGKLKIGDGSTAWTSLGYVSGGASVEVSDTPPSAPEANTLWWESDTGTLFIYYDSYWVEAVTGVVGPSGQDGADNIVTSATAPANTDVLWIDTSEAGDAVLPLAGTTGQVLVKASNSDYDTEWSDIAISDVTNLQSELNNRALSHNYIINGAMEINQRNFESTNLLEYTFDRWLAVQLSSTPTYSSQTFSEGEEPLQGFPAKNYIRVATSDQTEANQVVLYRQFIEDVRTLAGQTVTLSFWARAASGTPKIAVELGQASVVEPINYSFFGQATLSTSWVRYSVTGSLDSLAGMTIGDNSSLQVSFWVSAGADFDIRTGSLGLQNNTFDLWGVQLEAGSVATPFKRHAPSLQGELAACQRYFERVDGSGSFFGPGFVNSETLVYGVYTYKVEKRVSPTYSSSSSTALTVFTATTGTIGTTANSAAILAGTKAAILQVTPASTTVGGQGGLLGISGSGFVDFSAEL